VTAQRNERSPPRSGISADRRHLVCQNDPRFSIYAERVKGIMIFVLG
jgi:hypothetical protein